MPRTSLGRARITALSIVIGGFNACDRSARAPDGVAGLPQNHGAPAGHPGADRRLGPRIGLLLEPGVDLLDVEPPGMSQCAEMLAIEPMLSIFLMASAMRLPFSAAVSPRSIGVSIIASPITDG